MKVWLKVSDFENRYSPVTKESSLDLFSMQLPGRRIKIKIKFSSWASSGISDVKICILYIFCDASKDAFEGL